MDMELEFLMRIFCAALLGGLIGLEREYRAKEAGFRTHLHGSPRLGSVYDSVGIRFYGCPDQ